MEDSQAATSQILTFCCCSHDAGIFQIPAMLRWNNRRHRCPLPCDRDQYILPGVSTHEKTDSDTNSNFVVFRMFTALCTVTQHSHSLYTQLTMFKPTIRSNNRQLNEKNLHSHMTCSPTMAAAAHSTCSHATVTVVVTT